MSTGLLPFIFIHLLDYNLWHPIAKDHKVEIPAVCSPKLMSQPNPKPYAILRLNICHLLMFGL